MNAWTNDTALMECWEQYLAAERSTSPISEKMKAWLRQKQYSLVGQPGGRPFALKALELFLDTLEKAHDARKTRDAFAEAFCFAVVDKGEDLPLRMPLFERVIGPYLAGAYTDGIPSAPRWMAHFYDSAQRMARKNGMGALNWPEIGEWDLLREAIRREADNAVVVKTIRTTLLNKYASFFSYTLHELPAGVLYGHDGATVEQCRELLAQLAEFQEIARESGKTEMYREAVQDWAFHFAGYADYLKHRAEHTNYADYIRHKEATSQTAN